MTIIMQGNTYSASDCVAFENSLEATGNGYSSFARYGWTENSSTPSTQRVTEDEFKLSRFAHVAYYSGHGGTYWNSSRYPVLNCWATNSYGTSSAFNVATALGVAGENWETSCTIQPNDNLRVMVLASCLQLDSSIVKYYARVMKASSVRAVVGYHDIAPSVGDDTIATDFIQYSDEGSAIIAAWQYANPGQNWAVLELADDLNNDNQTVYMPGFPARIYEEPSSAASVYRYANFLTIPREESTDSNGSKQKAAYSLPLTITTSTATSNALDKESLAEYSRDAYWSGESVSDDDSALVALLDTKFDQDITDSICVQHKVTRETIDADIGVVSDSEVVLQRTYSYYDTYNGVKIVDSFVRGSIDSRGVNNVSVQKKAVTFAGTSIAQMTASSKDGVELISESTALKLILEDHECICNSELYALALAYVPDGNGQHVLCYEFMFSSGFQYVNVVTGEIIHVQ